MHDFDYDVAIIGAGLLGCFSALNFTRFCLKIAVFEKSLDVCTGMSKANTAIIYPGYDPVPGTLKARLNAAAILNFESLCNQLGVRLRRTGSLMVAGGPQSYANLRKKYKQGIANGVLDMKILSRDETLALEPGLSGDITAALYAGGTMTVSPWELCIAASECMVQNGVEVRFEEEALDISAVSGGFRLKTSKGEYTTRTVVNCAGIFADNVHCMVNRADFRLEITGADYLLLDKKASGLVRHVIMYEPEQKRRGVTIVPTVDGNVLLGPSKTRKVNLQCAETTREGCISVMKNAKTVLPAISDELVIRSFAAHRPSVELLDSRGLDTGEGFHDLYIGEGSAKGFFSLAGIKTPGLTCCDEIGKYVSGLVASHLGNALENKNFDLTRRAPVRFFGLDFGERMKLVKQDAKYASIICRCGSVTEAEIRSAIRSISGVVTLDSVKRRTGAQMGRCQGGYCTQRIIEIIADELGFASASVLKDSRCSEILL